MAPEWTPGALLMMAACVFLAFAAVHWTLAAWLARTLHGWQAVLCFISVLGVMYLSLVLAIRGQASGILLAASPLAAGALARALWLWQEQRWHERFDEEDIERYREAIAIDPANVAAHSLLADRLRRMGRLEEAIKEYEAALALDPSLKPERYWLERCRRRLEREAQAREALCPHCGGPMDWSKMSCARCGRGYATPRAKAPAWAAAMAVCALVAAAASRGGRPWLALALIVAVFVAAVAAGRQPGRGAR